MNLTTMTASGAMASLHTEPVRALRPSEKMKSRFDALRALNDATFLGIERPPEEVLKHAYLNYDVFVKEWGGKLLGFAIVNPTAPVVYLWQFAVDKNFRNIGVGSEILRSVHQYYANMGVPYIELTCKLDNPAQVLYFKNGYRVRDVSKKFYGDEGDGLRMSLDLRPLHLSPKAA